MTDLEKPVSRKARLRVPHGVKSEIVVTLYPNGEIGLRESARRDEYKLDLGTLYVHAMMSASRKIESNAKKIKKERGLSLHDARKIAKKELL